MKEKGNTMKEDFEALILAAYKISSDVGDEVEKALQRGREQPLTPEEAATILTKVIGLLRAKAVRKGDKAAQASLAGNIETLVGKMVDARERLRGPAGAKAARKPKLELVARDGIQPGPVTPRPCFHGREIPVMGGFVKTTDLKQWDHNERLEIHLGQFRQQNKREPTSQEVLDIMLTKMVLPGTIMPGVKDTDHFEIVTLARSIAVNGVRKPPILDIDGTPLDGNRRIAACYYILASDEFDTAAKRRAEYIYVWQLTEHATEAEREAVVVSLNFESDCKVDWPEYVKARKVHEEWQGMLALEPRDPSPQRQAQMKRELSKQFALGPDTTVVNRYLKMVDWATAFEEYHVNTRGKDIYEARHRTSRYFQYFDELAKGATTDGVAHALRQDEGFKHTVFDLLYDGKFKNWRQIRELKLIHENSEARDLLAKARTENDLELAEDHLEDAMSIARTRRAEQRELGANTRIETFVDWLEELPVRAFRDRITRDNLVRLRKAFRLVDGHAKAIIDETEA
jgi:hypothetical protein